MVSLKLFDRKSVLHFPIPRILVLKDTGDEEIKIANNYLLAFPTLDIQHFQNNDTNTSNKNMITEYS